MKGKSVPEPELLFFPGSFDPVHWGHIYLVRYLLARFQTSKVAVAPTPTPPHKDNERAPFLDRFRMLRSAFELELKSKRFCLSTIEKSMPAPQYTIHTLHLLQEKYNLQPALVMGDDLYPSLLNWHSGSKLAADFTVVVFRRESSSFLNKIHPHHILLNNPLWPQASRNIRFDKEAAKQYLPPSVHEYILSKRLY